FLFASRRRHTRFSRDWSSDVCSSDLVATAEGAKRTIIDLIPERASVGVPGSVTLRELGLLEALEKRGNKIVHHWDPSLVGEERKIGRASCRERVKRWVRGGSLGETQE